MVGGADYWRELGDYFKYFCQRERYSREAINQGTAIIRGNTVYRILNKLQ